MHYTVSFTVPNKFGQGGFEEFVTATYIFKDTGIGEVLVLRFAP